MVPKEQTKRSMWNEWRKREESVQRYRTKSSNGRTKHNFRSLLDGRTGSLYFFRHGPLAFKDDIYNVHRRDRSFIHEPVQLPDRISSVATALGFSRATVVAKASSSSLSLILLWAVACTDNRQHVSFAAVVSFRHSFRWRSCGFSFWGNTAALVQLVSLRLFRIWSVF